MAAIRTLLKVLEHSKCKYLYNTYVSIYIYIFYNKYVFNICISHYIYISIIHNKLYSYTLQILDCNKVLENVMFLIGIE